MIDRDKVKLMTDLEMFRKKEEKKSLTICRYRRKDFLLLHMAKTWLCISAAFFLAAFLIFTVIDSNSGTDSIAFENYFMSFIFFIMIYVIICVIFLWISYIYYSRKYKAALLREKEYRVMLAKMKKYFDNTCSTTDEAAVVSSFL